MKTRYAAYLAAAGFIAAMGSFAGTAVAAGEHEHGTHQAVLELDRGAKWHTDAALQQGMEKIRAEVEHALPAVHAGRYGAAQYEALAHSVDQQVAYIVKNCKLAPEADEALHVIIGEIGEGTEILSGRKAVGDRGQGVVRLARALERYGEHFDHPDWKGVKSGH